MAKLLPVSYTDGYVVSSVYLVSATAARGCIPNCMLQPIMLTKNRSVVVLTLFDFRASSIGPYREVSLGILASPSAPRIRTLVQLVTGLVGTWVVALPVTSDLACRGGIELFGYPKQVNPIEVSLTSRSCSYVVRDGSNELLSAHVPLQRGITVPIRRLVTYTELRGELRKTVIPVHWSPQLAKCKGTQIRLAGDTELVSALRRLELPAEPTFVLHGGGFRGTLSASAVLPAPQSR